MADLHREHYFDLPVSDQADLLQSLAPVMGRRAEILEKDIWLCQVLDILFQLPCRRPMAFKGGTSLSKVYKAIDRFSEDIDVTVNYRSLVVDAPELESITSNSQRSKLSDALKAALTTHVMDELVPALRSMLASALPTQATSIEVSDDAEDRNPNPRVGLGVHHRRSGLRRDEQPLPCGAARGQCAGPCPGR